MDILWSGQLAASARLGCVMATVTVRTTRMRITARRWCASCLTTCVLPMTPSVFLRRSCVMALTIVRMALTRNFVVKYSLHTKTFWHKWQPENVFSTWFICPVPLTLKNTTNSAFNSVSDIFQPFHLYFLPVDLCALDNGGCSHNCSIIPGEGFMCSCPLGMELGADNKTCQIQSFCAKHLKCSQRCEQEKSSVKCSCYEGWELESDMESCKSTGNEKQDLFGVKSVFTPTT